MLMDAPARLVLVSLSVDCLEIAKPREGPRIWPAPASFVQATILVVEQTTRALSGRVAALNAGHLVL